MPDAQEPSKLGSLAQSARKKHLNQARGILIAIGILTIVVNGAVIAFVPSLVKNQINKEIADLKAKGMIVDQTKVKEVEEQKTRAGYVDGGVGVFLGVLFVTFGLLVNRYPVPVTVLSLVFYVGAAIIFAVQDPATLTAGLIVKVIIVVALIKALQSALAFQKEKAREEAALETGL